MIYTVRINNKEYEVEVERGKANLLKTTEVSAPAPVATPQTVAPVQQVAPAPKDGANTIKAPMPGIILDIKAAPGTSVKRGDVVLILEAMKMENEITAPVDGVVSQVLVTKGSSVATGDSLITYQ
ncbi:MAG TPA: acetyl-CoA carboxylase biotin carboxyl carrier protein subunit [Clostridiales bacterium]|mgnify:CR=1 FL=1|nr:acetyl-CoA carboxylase biotin carboxyl carrier protein subunit [Clostridiales bacterium]